jgi:hypothetical protein
MTEKQVAGWRGVVYSAAGVVLASLIVGAATWFWTADHKLTAIDYKLETIMGLRESVQRHDKDLADHARWLQSHDDELKRMKNSREARQ